MGIPSAVRGGCTWGTGGIGGKMKGAVGGAVGIVGGGIGDVVEFVGSKLLSKSSKIPKIEDGKLFNGLPS